MPNSSQASAFAHVADALDTVDFLFRYQNDLLSTVYPSQLQALLQGVSDALWALVSSGHTFQEEATTQLLADLELVPKAARFLDALLAIGLPQNRSRLLKDMAGCMHSLVYIITSPGSIIESMYIDGASSATRCKAIEKVVESFLNRNTLLTLSRALQWLAGKAQAVARIVSELGGAGQCAQSAPSSLLPQQATDAIARVSLALPSILFGGPDAPGGDVRPDEIVEAYKGRLNALYKSGLLPTLCDIVVKMEESFVSAHSVHGICSMATCNVLQFIYFAAALAAEDDRVRAASLQLLTLPEVTRLRLAAFEQLAGASTGPEWSLLGKSHGEEFWVEARCYIVLAFCEPLLCILGSNSNNYPGDGEVDPPAEALGQLLAPFTPPPDRLAGLIASVCRTVFTDPSLYPDMYACHVNSGLHHDVGIRAFKAADSLAWLAFHVAGSRPAAAPELLPEPAWDHVFNTLEALSWALHVRAARGVDASSCMDIIFWLQRKCIAST